MKTSPSKSILETKNFSRETYQLLLREKEKATGAKVLALSGDLGSGKTTFTQFLAKEFGVKKVTASPTFVLMRKYKVPKKKDSKISSLIHIDAYRLKSENELLSLGWTDLIKKKENLIVVEWAEKIKKILPQDTLWIFFRHAGESLREVGFKKT